MKFYSILVSLVLFWGSCCESSLIVDPCPPKCDTIPSTFISIVWKERASSNSGNFTFTPYILDESVFHSISLSGDDYDTIVTRNKYNGAKSNQYVHNNHSVNVFTKGSQYFFDNTLFFAQNKQFVKLNLLNNSVTEFNTDPTFFNLNRFYFKNWNIYGASEKKDEVAKLFVINANNGASEDLITLNINNGFSPSIEISQIITDQNQDSIIIFQNRQYNFPKSLDKVDLYAMRIKDKQILWKVDSLTSSGNSSVSIGAFRNGKIFFCGDNVIYCLNSASGKIVWQFNFLPPDSRTLLKSDPVLSEDKLIVKADDNTIWAFDPNTGYIIWQNHDGGENPTNLTLFGNRLYYASLAKSRIYCHDINTGEVIWKYKVESKDFFDQGFGGSGVGIDPETGYLYVHDFYYIYCLKENK